MANKNVCGKEIKQIEKLEAEIHRIKRLAYVDELTGLFNRHGFKVEADKFLHELNAPKEEMTKRRVALISNFSIIMVDADHFKKVNDVYGHPTGDAILKMLAVAITGRVRDLDMVGRWGGEEIIIGLPGASENDAAMIADIIREKVEKERVVSKKKSVGVTISSGVAAHAHGDTLEALIHKADKALYEAKHRGRNCVVRFTELKSAK